MIIVTGGAGFIGSNIVKALNDKGITDILVVDNLKDGTKFVNLVDLNIADYMDKEDFLIQIMAGEEFGDVEAIFHEGACSSTTEWDGKYMMDNNYQYSKELLHYCLEREIPFLYASSAATYGGRTSDFIESREYEKPLNVYGYSKFLFDEYVRQILPEANSQIVGFRYFNVYGPREGHKGSMASVAFHLNTQLNNGESPKLFEGSENFKRDFVYVGDVADVNLWFLENGVSGIFNRRQTVTRPWATIQELVGVSPIRYAELLQQADATLPSTRKARSNTSVPEQTERPPSRVHSADPMNLRAGWR